MIARTPEALKTLLESEEEQLNSFPNKVPPVKTSFYKAPNPMEAIEEISRYPSLTTYLEEKASSSEEDFYLLRKEFAKFAKDNLPLNEISSLILGEAYAKKVRYGVTYSTQIEDVISYLVDKLEKELAS